MGPLPLSIYIIESPASTNERRATLVLIQHNKERRNIGDGGKIEDESRESGDVKRRPVEVTT